MCSLQGLQSTSFHVLVYCRGQRGCSPKSSKKGCLSVSRPRRTDTQGQCDSNRPLRSLKRRSLKRTVKITLSHPAHGTMSFFLFFLLFLHKRQWKDRFTGSHRRRKEGKSGLGSRFAPITENCNEIDKTTRIQNTPWSGKLPRFVRTTHSLLCRWRNTPLWGLALLCRWSW